MLGAECFVSKFTVPLLLLSLRIFHGKKEIEMTKPAWLLIAEKDLGVKEIKGPKHNSIILAMWKLIKRGGIKDDETAWCAAAVGSWFEKAGIVSSRFESAKSYEAWGQFLASPVVGCVAVFTRDGGGHVALVVGQDKAGNLICLGGNQGDEVNYRAFPRSRVTAYRWPAGYPVPPAGPLPILDPVALSKGEA